MVHDLVRRAGNISVHVIAGEDLAEQGSARAVIAADRLQAFEPLPYVVALAAVAGALGVSLILKPRFGVENVDLIFLTAIVGVAVRYGLWPSLAASVAASLCYNFFFLPPVYTFTITDPTNVAAFVLFTILAVVVSNLAGRGRTQTVTALQRVRSIESLYAFSRKLAGAGTLDDVLWATAHQIAAMLKVRVVLLLPDSGSIAVKGGFPPEDRLDEADLAAAKWAWEQNRPAGRDSDALPGAKWLFLPMRTGRGAIGIVGICRDEPGPLLRADQRRLLDALADQGALAIERVHLVEDIERVRREAEADRLRSALLTSISHDLRTPLAAVLGAAGALRDLPKSLDDDAKADLLATIIDESERLNRFIANLLDMTKLESGAVVPNMAPHDVGEIVGSALERARKILARHRVEVAIPSDLPMIAVDPVLFEQVLFNLLDNAAKYAPAGTTIRIQGWAERDAVKLQVLDEGDGIPPDDLERIFDKFHRAQKGDHVRAGTGFGLSISRGFVEAMHGTITAANRTDRCGRGVHDHVADRAIGRFDASCRMSTGSLKILVVDDEPPIRKLLRMGLTSQGYEVLDAPNGKTALELLAKKPDLVILDLGLPDIDGLELLRRIRHREESLPVVVLSSRGDEAGKVAALDLGADDYVTKPFGMDELFARMRAALRHQLQVHGERPVFQVGDLSVDLVRRIVKLGDKEVKLSPKEYELLRLLVQHAGKVLTHRFLLQELWDEPTDTQYLRVYVRQLRRKIETDPERPQYLLTETGIGYRLRAPTD